MTNVRNDEIRFFWKWMGISLFFHLLTGIFSVGYQAVDEHFQILEFLNFKMGKTPLEDLPVEFGEKMRPFLQVWLYGGVIKIAHAFGITNPHTWALLIRELTGILGWLSIVSLAQSALLWFGDLQTQKIAITALALCWYFPAMHVRPSSEGLGGSAFVLGICLLFLTYQHQKQSRSDVPMQDRPRPLAPATSPLRLNFLGVIPLRSAWCWFLGGALLGLSFEARFQMALMLLGAALWFIFQARIQLSQWALSLFGFGVVFGAGRLADYWGYGTLCFSPWNYFSYNILRGEVSRYGRSPWWDIFRMSITESWPILGILLAILVVIGWARFRRHLLTWCHLPFFLVHCMIAHKEYRFFFPIGNSAPILAILSLVSPKTYGLDFWKRVLTEKKSRFLRPLLLTVLGFLFINNLVGLVSLSVIPMARNVYYQEAVSKRVIPGHEFRIYTDDRDPFVISGSPTYFYRPSEVQVHHVNHLSELSTLPKEARPFWFFHGTFEIPSELQASLPFCSRSFSTLPDWIKYFNWNNWLSRANVWSLYYCSNESGS
ncbi:MAG: hypothetical protein HYX41_01060 [Bdellovibrio sp.]|nr:hypothetical protein [Bdellovibrio sp.]